jgi:VIT1/CCC1 family predicted Fe2+/Mn2+ transporter
MTSYQQSEFGAIILFMLGAFLPLLASAMVPNGWQRIGGALFSVIALAVMTGMLGGTANALRWGLSIGFSLAALKLTTGLRFI